VTDADIIRNALIRAYHEAQARRFS